MCKPTVTSMQRRALLKLAALSTIGLARAQATAKPNASPSIPNTEPITMDEAKAKWLSYSTTESSTRGHRGNNFRTANRDWPSPSTSGRIVVLAFQISRSASIWK